MRWHPCLSVAKGGEICKESEIGSPSPADDLSVVAGRHQGVQRSGPNPAETTMMKSFLSELPSTKFNKRVFVREYQNF